MNTTATTQPVSFRSLFSSRFATVLCFALGLMVCLVGLNPTPVQAQTFNVNLASDGVGNNPGDHNPGDGVCDADANQSGNQCTLRAAIQEANSDTDRDIVDFSQIPTTGGFATISVVEEIEVTEEIFIDGTTAPNYPSASDGPIVKLDGSGISGSKADGLQISKTSGATPAGSNITGLAITNFPDDGINITSANIEVRDCFIGLDVDGSTVQGNNRDPDNLSNGGIVLVRDNHNIISNVISGNQANGVFIGNGDGNVDPNLADNNTIQSNTIGMTADGNTTAGNGGDGVHIEDGTGNFVGNYSSPPLFISFGNTISGNSGSGVVIESDGNTVISNEIGTLPDGTGERPNSSGVVLLGNNNTVGGSDNLATNVISGNDFNGIRFGIGGGTSADNNTVENNLIGTNLDGTSAIPNGDGCVEAGVRFDQGSDNTITSNVIAGNTAHGVFIRGDSFRNDVTNNYVGTNSSAADLGNDCDGVLIETDAGSFLDENRIHDGNVIGHNGNHGVHVTGAFATAANNFIGTNANGNDLGNGADGIHVSANGVLAGRSGTLGEGGNTIGFNGSGGIHVINASNLLILGNYIGTNANGDNIANPFTVGLEIEATSGNAANNNVIGYDYGDSFSDPLPSAGGDGNVIANHGDGIRFSGDGTMTDNSVRGNSVYANSSEGLNLGANYVNGNDNGDGDGGTNNSQNHPVISNVTNCDDSSSPTTVDVTFKVRSNSGDSNYGSNGLKVDFYVADSEASGEGKTYIQTETYNNPLNDVGTVLQTDDATCDDFFVATATDADGNTSEFFSPSQQLPVELTTFDAQADGETVQLSWKTASETNNAGFDVQRKRSGEEQWTKVGFVEGHGTTSEPQTYSFDDAGVPFEADSLRYRLKQVDLDGAFEYSEAVEVAIAAPEELALHGNYPNPFAGQTTIRYEVPTSGDVRLAVYDVLGQRVALLANETQDAGRKEMTFTARNLSSGVYFVRLTHDGTTRTQKMTIVR